MKRLIKHIGVAVAIVSATSAYGVGTLRLSSDGGGTWSTAVDEGAGDTSVGVGNVGVVTFNGAVGTWIVNVTTGITKPVLGTGAIPHMDLNSVDVTSAGGGNLIIQWSDDNFVGPTPGSFKAEIGGTTSGSVVYNTFGDLNNVLFANDGVTAQSTLGVFSGGAFSGTTAAPLAAPAGNYSLTMQTIITHAGAGATSFDASLETVPEGGMTLMLLGSSLAGLAFFRRKLSVKA